MSMAAYQVSKEHYDVRCYCEVCQIKFQTPEQLAQHLDGNLHRQAVRRLRNRKDKRRLRR